MEKNKWKKTAIFRGVEEGSIINLNSLLYKII
jgi:hypothetical protein